MDYLAVIWLSQRFKGRQDMKRFTSIAITASLTTVLVLSAIVYAQKDPRQNKPAADRRFVVTTLEGDTIFWSLSLQRDLLSVIEDRETGQKYLYAERGHFLPLGE
jgi:hypothetical protein